MDAKVTWHEGMSFTGTADSGFTLPLGNGESAGGKANETSPMELIAVSLASCTAMDVISILLKKRQDVTAFSAEVHASRATEHPKVFTSAVIEYSVSGHNVDEAAVVRSIELSVIRYCPVYAMLSKVMPIELKYEIFEDEGDGRRRLAKAGRTMWATQNDSTFVSK